MGSKWPVVRLGNHCLKIGSGATPKGGSSVYSDSGSIWLIRSQNIYNDGFNPSGLVFISEGAADKLKNVIVQENDILLNITGDSVARVCLAKKEYLPARVNQHVAIIRPDPKHFDARYLRYVLASPVIQQILLNLASAGATRNALTKVMIEEFEVSKPPLSIQIAVADHLESFDDKITLNRQINQTLEQMAQTLFKSWFVDFDPVIDNALDAGNDIPDTLQERAEQRRLLRAKADFKPLPAETRALFPSEFEETELGWVPKGWEVNDVGSFAHNIFSGGTPHTGTAEYWNGELCWFSSGETRERFILETEKKITQSGASNSSTRLATYGDILIASAGQGYTRGQSSLNLIDTYINQSVVSIRTIEKSDSYWLFENISSRYEELRAISDSHSIRGSLTTKLVASLKLIVPHKSVLDVFAVYYEQWLRKIVLVKKEISTLTLLRDSLLPKLISGELALDDLPEIPSP